MSKKRILQEGLAGQALEAEAEKTAQAAAEAAEAALLQANEAIESKKRKRLNRKADEDNERDGEDSDSEIEDDGYDADLYGDEEDRRKLFAMSEIDRERILAERYEQRQRIADRRAARREKKARLESASNRSKRTKETTSSALDDLRRRTSKKDTYEDDDDEPDYEDDDYFEGGEREKKKKMLREMAKKRKEKERRGRGRTRKQRDDDDDEDDEDDTRYGVGKPRDPEAYRMQRAELAASITIDKIHRLQLKRSHFKKWHEELFFEKAVVGLFVRVGIGSDGMKPVYRLARVESVRESSRKYKVDKLWETHKVLELAIADKKREFQISNVSNESVTRSEFEFWIKNLTSDDVDVPIPDQDDFDQLERQLQQAENYVHKEEDIQKMLERKANLGKEGETDAVQKRRALLQLRGNPAAVKAALQAARRQAEVDGDIAEAQRISTVLENIDEATQKRVSRGANTAQVGNINERNRRNNFSRSLALQQAAREAKARAGDDEFNAFQRRKAKAQVIVASRRRKGKEEEAAEENKAEQEKKAAEEAAKNEAAAAAAAQAELANAGEEHSQLMQQAHGAMALDDLFDTSNAAGDVVRGVASSAVVVGLARPVATTTLPQQAKKLSLGDYLKRK